MMMKAKGIHSSKVIGLWLDGPFQPVVSIFSSCIPFNAGNILSSSHPIWKLCNFVFLCPFT